MPKKKVAPAPPVEDEVQALRGIEDFPNPVLVSTDWFRGPDGEQYQCIWGRARFVAGDDLDPKLPDPAKLFLAIGSGEREVLVDWAKVTAVLTCLEMPHRTSIYVAQDDDSLELPLD